MSNTGKIKDSNSSRSPLDVGPASVGEKKPPALSNYVSIGEKMQKLGHIIFKSGEVLLTHKIDQASKGQPEEKYSVSQHLEMLNKMFPQMREFNPEEMKKKVNNFIDLAKKKKNKAPQAKMDRNAYAGQIWDEEQRTFMKLLQQADMVSLEPVQQQYSRHGAQSRYEGKSKTVDVDALEEEEEEMCVNCGNQKHLVEIPDVGKVCRACIAAQEAGGAPNILNKASQQQEVSCLLCGNLRDLNVIPEVGNVCSECVQIDGGKLNTRTQTQQEEEVNIQLNKELHEMDDSPYNIPRGPKNNNGASSSRRNFDEDNSNTDDEIRTALLGHLRMSSKREVLETEKARLDVLIKQKELEKLGGNKNDEI